MRKLVLIFPLLGFFGISSLHAQVYDFNAIHGVIGNHPQFSAEPVQDGEVIRAYNGGLGDGMTTTGSPMTIGGTPLSQETYFCNSQDEENSFLHLSGENTVNVLNAKGSFHFLKIRDRWREQRDNKALYLGAPLVATNCTRSGQRSTYDETHWRYTDSATPFRNFSDLRSAIRNHFRTRNFMEDNADFRYGRYLFKFIDRQNFDPDNDFRLFGNPTLPPPGNNAYDPFLFKPNYLDCSYGREQQRWGFLCGEMAAAGAYTDLHLPPAQVSPLIPNAPIHPQQWNFYKDLLKQAIDLIGVRIDQEYWGRVRPRFSLGGSAWEENEREMSGIIVTLWEILKQVQARMSTTPPSGATRIVGHCANTPEGVLVALDRSGSNPKFAFRKDLCIDTQARRTISHPYFNVWADPNQPGITALAPTYGTLVDGGLYETLFTPSGYRWVLDQSGSSPQMRANPIDGNVPSNGYGALIVGFMAHQGCHLFYRERGNSFQWGGPQASNEEDFCMMSQALIIQTLGDLGHLRNGTMQSEEYNPDSNPNDTNPQEDGFVGRHFYYADEQRAMNNIAVAPLHEDMMVIAHNLQQKDHETARMAAHLTALCPFFPEPQNACLNGVCGSNPYYVAPVQAEAPAQPPQQSG
ncbi:MAG: hypothetical protein Q7T11_02285, partial [Deltaproteobacteria bacterium]|nr:hypothetical protein [Deltaproteobacteria bacterium]